MPRASRRNDMQDHTQLGPIPDLPINQDGPVFDEPWQLTAFGIVVMLHRNGHFEWHEWVHYLSTEIARGNIYGASDINGIYYRQWLAALEKIVADKGLTSFEDLVARKEEWRHADEHRDFGQPLVLHRHDHDHANHDHGHHHHDHAAVTADGDEPHLCRQPAARHVAVGHAQGHQG